jgi:hypothetical protein
LKTVKLKEIKDKLFDTAYSENPKNKNAGITQSQNAERFSLSFELSFSRNLCNAFLAIYLENLH